MKVVFCVYCKVLERNNVITPEPRKVVIMEDSHVLAQLGKILSGEQAHGKYVPHRASDPDDTLIGTLTDPLAQSLWSLGQDISHQVSCQNITEECGTRLEGVITTLLLMRLVKLFPKKIRSTSVLVVCKNWEIRKYEIQDNSGPKMAHDLFTPEAVCLV